jgi:hypothetical protein
LRKVLAGCLCAIVAAAPAVAFAATNDDNNTSESVTIVPQADSQLSLKHDARQKLQAGHARVQRVKHKRQARRERIRARKLAKQQQATSTTTTTTGSTTTSTGSAPSGNLQAIAACESGGNPSAVGGGGAFRGKYQFDYSTWASVGGSGDPAAAPESEQDMRAQMLYERSGSSPWPVCGQ